MEHYVGGKARHVIHCNKLAILIWWEFFLQDERDKQPKYGKKFNLTAQQVKEILEAKEDK